MKQSILALTLALTLPLSACSLEDLKEKGNEYSSMTPGQLAEQLVKDGGEASNKAKLIALCQARVITRSKLPDAVIDALLKDDGRTVAERAHSLKRPGLGKKLSACVKKYK